MFARRADLARTFALGGELHEIAIRVKDASDVDRVAGELQRDYPGLDVATWRDLSPEVALTNDSTRQMNYIFLVVILVALVFGITNTMLMGVLERTRELGVVIALGMRPAPVFAMVLVETILLSVVGGARGRGARRRAIAVLGRTPVSTCRWSSQRARRVRHGHA